MCCLRNKAMRDYQESVTTGQTDTHTQTDARQSDPYVPLCFAGDTKMKYDDNSHKVPNKTGTTVLKQNSGKF